LTKGFVMRRSAAALAGLALAGLAALALPPAAAAQERPNLMIVFDASGSMWGQIRGRTKIELAREALSSVLSEADAAMDIGLIAYGHRVRGQCSDIEMVVPPGPAGQTVPQILNFAGRVNPRGMTPLSESVLRAAQRLGFTEQAATVVLLTDGIETCGGDPCALGRMLAESGVDFRAHVVGFDLTDAEQRQVACLAEETGGMFLAANDAVELRDALARTLAVDPLPEPEPEPANLPRRVDLILRDVAGGPVLTGRPFRAMEFVPQGEGAEVTGRLDLSANPGPLTGRVELRPGRYTLMALRATDGREPIRIAIPVEIPEGAGTHTVDLVIAARLRLNARLHAGQPMPEGMGRLPRLSGQGWSVFEIHPVIDGAIDPSVDYGGLNSRDLALPPGDYFVRGYLDRHFARERLIRVQPGETTTVDFDLGAATVTVDLRDPQGFPVDRYDVRVFDPAAETPFLSGNGRDRTELNPLYLPVGLWRIEAVAQRGDRRPAVARVAVTPGQALDLRLIPGATQGSAADLPEDAAPTCHDTHGWYGCVVEVVTPVEMVRHLGLDGRGAAAQMVPRYTGTWQTHDRMMVLVQEGRRVWGEVHVNGGIGRVWGHVAHDGLTLRGAMDRSSSPRGVMELRLDPAGQTLVGFWDHNIGRMGSALRARRLSGGVPPLTRATGTEDDLRLNANGSPWAPADSPAFAAFMAPARAPAGPDTGEDIDAMQRLAADEGFAGVWNTNHQQLTLQQDGRRVWGRRDRGAIWGEVSADGQVLRGLWINSGEWGYLEFRLDPARMGFAGTWGRARDGGVRANERWTGSRVGWLVPGLDPVAPPGDAAGPAFEAFMEPVRDPDLPAPDLPAPDLPDPDRADAGAALPAIGAIAVLPPGIYGMARARSEGELARWLRQGADDPALAAEFAETCAREPRVVHPDGLIAVRMFDPRRAAAGQAPWSTDFFLRCEQNGPLFACDGFNRPLAANPDLADPDYRIAAMLVAGAGGLVAVDEGGGNAMVLRSCLGQGGVLDAAELAPSGRPIVDHIADREDGGDSPAFDPQGRVTGSRGQPGGDAPVTADPVDFATAAGIWHNPARESCATGPVTVHPDGAIAIWTVSEGTHAELRLHLLCDAGGACRIVSDPLPPPGRDRIRLQTGGPGLQLCVDGQGCVEGLARCDTSGAPAGLMAALMQRPWEAAPGPASPPAPTPAPLPGAGGLTPIPPGLWHVEAPWSDPMPAPGTAAFVERCLDGISATFPDGLTLGFELYETAGGPEFAAPWSEVCWPSGDPAWPFACTAEDGHVADAGAAVSTSRLRVERVSAERVELTQISDHDPEPALFVLHACVRPDGRGIDLTGDPRGRALAQAVAQARGDGGPGLDLAALQRPAAAVPAPAPAAPRGGLFARPSAAPAFDAALAGLWFPVADGRRPAVLTDDEVATACFETPVRLHADGLAVAFRTRDGQPVADSHLRCDGGMGCDYAAGAPSEGGPVQGRALMRVVTQAELELCLGSDCLALGRCPAPGWSARERASGLAARWEAAVEARD